MGRAEVRVAFNDRAERYHSRNLVTERVVIGLCNHVTERVTNVSFFLSNLTLKQLDITKTIEFIKKIQYKSCNTILHLFLQELLDRRFIFYLNSALLQINLYV